MKTKECYNVLAVYSLRYKAGRDHFTGILDEIGDKNWHLSAIPPERFISESELMNEHGEPYDGFILSMPGTDAVMARIAQSNTPTVLVNITDRRLAARCDAVASVWLDNADAGRCAARHLLDRGEYKAIGYVHGTDQSFYSEERMAAFRQTMKRNGYETAVFPYDDDFSDYSGRLRRWLREIPKPAGIMATADMCAARIINICKDEGIDVPSQVSVIGADHDISQYAKCGMSISSVITNMYMMGRQAVKELDFLFRHPNWRGRTHEVLIPAKGVFVGESTARSVSAARLVEIGLDFIYTNRDRDLSPAEVAAHLGCSRSLAELRFSQVKSTTIRKAIENVRLDEVQRRLRNGESVSEIVKSMHFTSANQLYRIYKRHFGHTTRQTAQTRFCRTNQTKSCFLCYNLQ